MSLQIQSKISNLEWLERWWKCVVKNNKEAYDAIHNAILNDMYIAELEPLGVNEEICVALEEKYIYSIKDLMLLDFNSLSKINKIGTKSLFKILKALKNLPKLDEEKKIYLKSITPNIEDMFIMKQKKININSQLDQIYDTIDELLLEGKFSEIDRILEQVDTRIDLNLLLGYLTATYPARSKLNKRVDLFNKVKLLAQDKQLLKGLE